MSSPFVAEIRIFPFNFAPRGWAFCDGQILPISQNTALFSLIGTYYGGDGRSNFALPNLQGSVPLGEGQGPGLSFYDLGEALGSPTVDLLQSEIPIHTHSLEAYGHNGTSASPGGNALAGTAMSLYNSSTSGLMPMSQNAVGLSGGSQPHNNLMPYLVLNFCIALQGIFPPRS